MKKRKIKDTEEQIPLIRHRKQLPRKTIFKIVLILYCIFVSANYIIWLFLHQNPPWGMGLPFMLNGGKLCFILENEGFKEFIKEAISFKWYPPLLRYIFCAYYLIFGITSEKELIVNIAFLIIGILGIYGIGKNLHSRRAGLLAAIIFSSMPIVTFFSKSSYPEFHMSCAAAASLYLLFESKLFRKRRYSILFGISFGLVMLIKWEAIIIFIIPLSLAFIRASRIKSALLCQKVKVNIICSAISAYVVLMPWYLIYLNKYKFALKPNVKPLLSFSPMNILKYLNEEVIMITLGFTYAIIVFVCFIKLINIILNHEKLKKHYNLALMCLCFIASSSIIFIIDPNNITAMISHFSPASIFLSLIISILCFEMKSLILKRGLISTILIYALSSQINSSVNISSFVPDTNMAKL